MATIPRKPIIISMKARSLGATTLAAAPYRFMKPSCPAARYMVVRIIEGHPRYVMTYKTLHGAQRYRQRIRDRDADLVAERLVRIFDLNLILADGLAEVPERVYQVDLFAGVRREEE